MGLLSKLKAMFNKNIECENCNPTHMVIFMDKKKFMYLGKNVIVRDNTWLVVVYKSRVTDVILPGKYKITEQIIPETYRRAKIEKYRKQGKKIKKIRVDLYLVGDRNYTNFNFDSDEPFFVKSKELGRIKGYMKGECTVKVIDPLAIVKALTHETGKEKTAEVAGDIGLWIGNKINKRIEKNKIPIESIINNNEYVNSILNTDLENGYDDIGLFVKNIQCKAIDFPKKHQRKVNEYMASHNARIKPIIDSISRNQRDEKVCVQNTRALSVNDTMQNSKIYLNSANFVTCNRCGFKNAISSDVCNNCGNKLK